MEKLKILSRSSYIFSKNSDWDFYLDEKSGRMYVSDYRGSHSVESIVMYPKGNERMKVIGRKVQISKLVDDKLVVVANLENNVPVISVGMAKDEKWVFTWDEDNMVQIWSMSEILSKDEHANAAMKADEHSGVLI